MKSKLLPYNEYFSNSFICKNFENLEPFLKVNFCNVVSDMALSIVESYHIFRNAWSAFVFVNWCI